MALCVALAISTSFVTPALVATTPKITYATHEQVLLILTRVRDEDFLRSRNLLVAGSCYHNMLLPVANNPYFGCFSSGKRVGALWEGSNELDAIRNSQISI